jgi:hypothetical protein
LRTAVNEEGFHVSSRPDTLRLQDGEARPLFGCGYSRQSPIAQRLTDGIGPRVKDESSAKQLRRMSGAVNCAWNHCCATQRKAPAGAMAKPMLRRARPS